MNTAIIFHGFPDALKANNPLYSYFKERGWRLIMPDLLTESYHFNATKVIKNTMEILGDTYPNVIIGISLGGLLAPFLAKSYPKSKLVLIGTGPYFKTKIWIYNFLVYLEANDKNLYLIKLLKLTPRWLFRFIYKIFNRSDSLPNADYRSRADENYDGTFRVPTQKIREILSFVTTTNNKNLLQNLTNETLIFAGKSDLMMPLYLSKELNYLIKGSKLRISNRLHYDVFSKEDVRFLDRFIN